MQISAKFVKGYSNNQISCKGTFKRIYICTSWTYVYISIYMWFAIIIHIYTWTGIFRNVFLNKWIAFFPYKFKFIWIWDFFIIYFEILQNIKVFALKPGDFYEKDCLPQVQFKSVHTCRSNFKITTATTKSVTVQKRGNLWENKNYIYTLDMAYS